MDNRNIIVNQLIVAVIIMAFIAGMFAFTAKRSDDIQSTLTPKQKQLRSAVLRERRDEVVSLLTATKNAEEVHELADAVSVANSDVSYGTLVEGKKETLMFYHSDHRLGWKTIAGVVLQR